MERGRDPGHRGQRARRERTRRTGGGMWLALPRGMHAIGRTAALLLGALSMTHSAGAATPRTIANGYRAVNRMAEEPWVGKRIRGFVRTMHKGMSTAVRAYGGYRTAEVEAF